MNVKKGVIVGLDRYRKGMLNYYLDELENLAQSLNIEIEERFTQSKEYGTPAYKVGKGKVEEIKAYTDMYDIDYVIFNEELSNSQIRNLEEAFDCAVIDRTLLILDIFAKKAKTREAMLQVEIAQLKYLKPRLTAMRSSFEQQQGGIGQKGPGEKKLELDRRKLDKELRKLEKQLANIMQTRKTNRLQRSSGHIKNVAIVGYTNAGKSTLINVLRQHSQLEGKDEMNVEDRLFATLETSTRRLQFKEKKPFTITDTIGFIAHLPHELVDSFKATLEEIKEADLLIHVIDFSHPYYLDQIQTTEQVLEELGADEIETLYLFNKIDLTNDILPHAYRPAMKVSLKDGTNIDLLIDTINKLLFKDDTIAVYKIPQTRGDLVSELNDHAEIIRTDYEDDFIVIKAKVDSRLKGRFRQYEA